LKTLNEARAAKRASHHKLKEISGPKKLVKQKHAAGLTRPSRHKPKKDQIMSYNSSGDYTVDGVGQSKHRSVYEEAAHNEWLARVAKDKAKYEAQKKTRHEHFMARRNKMHASVTPKKAATTWRKLSGKESKNALDAASKARAAKRASHHNAHLNSESNKIIKPEIKYTLKPKPMFGPSENLTDYDDFGDPKSKSKSKTGNDDMLNEMRKMTGQVTTAVKIMAVKSSKPTQVVQAPPPPVQKEKKGVQVPNSVDATISNLYRTTHASVNRHASHFVGL